MRQNNNYTTDFVKYIILKYVNKILKNKNKYFIFYEYFLKKYFINAESDYNNCLSYYMRFAK